MTVDKKLKDNFIETWRMEINDMSQCYLYKFYKTEFKFENYLVQLITQSSKILCKFRMNNTRLPILSQVDTGILSGN